MQPDIAEIARGRDERHPHTCDCEWCWLGVTTGAPPEPRPSMLARFSRWVRDHLLSKDKTDGLR